MEEINVQSLKNSLREWQDQDVAGYFLGCALGMFPPDDGSLHGFRLVKGIFWGGADHEAGVLIRILDDLVHANILEWDSTTQRYRWKPGEDREENVGL